MPRGEVYTNRRGETVMSLAVFATLDTGRVYADLTRLPKARVISRRQRRIANGTIKVEGATA